MHPPRKAIADAVVGRHPSTAHFAKVFAFEHLPAHLRGTSELCHDLAVGMIETLNDGPELSAGLRKLREAKDCFVTQRVIDSE